VVVVLLLIAFFTAISGKPLDGVLMLVVAIALAAGAGRGTGAAGRDVPAGSRAPVPPAVAPAAALPAARAPRRGLMRAGALAAGAGYAVVVGSFGRYSWPATIAVVAAGAAVVARGWRGPVRPRPSPELPAAGTALWAGVLVAGGLWELLALLQQPDLTTGSYAHPTISTLTGPLLATAGGRALLLGAWLVLGWALMRR
jgi:hypothetical protein